MDADDDVMTIGGMRVRNSDALVQRLDDPATVAALLDLLDVLPTLSGSLQVLQGFVSHSEHILDNVRDSVVEMVGMVAGTPEADTVRKVAELGKQSIPLAEAVADSGIVGQLADSGAIENLANSGLLHRAADPETLATLGALLDAVGVARQQASGSTRTYGPFALLRELKDPDVSRGLDFALAVLRSLGKSLGDAPATSTTR